MLKALYEKPVDVVINVVAFGVEQITAAVEVVGRRISARPRANVEPAASRDGGPGSAGPHR